MAQVIKDIVTWLKQWFYTESEVDSLLSAKVSVNQGSSNASKNVVTDSGGAITFEAKPTIPSASSSTPSADVTSGATGTSSNYARADHQHPLSSAYATSNHNHGDLQSDGQVGSTATNNGIVLTDSNGKITASTSIALNTISVGTSNNTSKNVVTDVNGKITLQDKPSVPSPYASTPSADTENGSAGTSSNYARGNHTHPKSSLYAEASHEHLATDIVDSNAGSYTNIDNSLTATSTQTDINTAINTVIGSLSSINAIEVVDTKPTASASTMGKLYIVSESNKVNVYYTKRTGTSPNYTYTWQKMDTDILDELSISWNDVTNKPTNILNSTITLVDAGETNEGCIIFNTL